MLDKASHLDTEKTSSPDLRPLPWWAWLNSNRAIIVVAWVGANLALWQALPPVMRALPAVAALAASLVARDRVLTVLFAVVTVGQAASWWLFGY
jgi:hypothetical protein